MTSAENGPMSWCVKLSIEGPSQDMHDGAPGMRDSLLAHLQAARIGQGNADAFEIAPQINQSAAEWVTQLQATRPTVTITELVITLVEGSCVPRGHAHVKDTELVVANVLGGMWVVLRDLPGAINWK